MVRRARPLLGSGKVLIASDFDGTLSELVLEPWAAVIVPRSQRALRRFAALAHVHVALISGRTVDDLARRARIGGASYRGDHGAERAEAPRGFRPAALRARRETARSSDVELVAALVAAVPAAVPEPWLVVEDKVGTVTFHVRGAPDVVAARARVLGVVDALDPAGMLLRSGSHRALELRPPDASTKGDALRRLIDDYQPDAVLMLGDDRNDALAFEVVRSLRSTGAIEGLAIAVASHADVTDDVAPQADVLLAGPLEVSRCLWALASIGEGA